MVKVYANLIIAKRRTIDSVPKNLQKDVVDMLYSMGYDEHGDPITEEVEENE